MWHIKWKTILWQIQQQKNIWPKIWFWAIFLLFDFLKPKNANLGDFQMYVMWHIKWKLILWRIQQQKNIWPKISFWAIFGLFDFFKTQKCKFGWFSDICHVTYQMKANFMAYSTEKKIFDQKCHFGPVFDFLIFLKPKNAILYIKCNIWPFCENLVELT